MQFSTLNESSLHNTLKIFYAEQTNGKTEVELNKHIYDIVCDDKSVIEIQTKNLSKLYNKIEDTLKNGIKIKLIHPIAIKKTIITRDTDGKIISTRKSPVKGSIYDIFHELTKLYPFLLDKNFELEVVEITMIEERTKTEKNVQSKNRKRRFKKDWIKTNKRLEEILNTRNFSSKEDYLKLLPKNLPEEFCTNDIKKLLKETKLAGSRITNNANIITWLYSRMNIIEFTEKKGRSNFYKLVK